MTMPALNTVDWSDVMLYVLLASEQPCNHCGCLLLHNKPIVLAAEGLPKREWWKCQSEVYCDPICKELQGGSNG